MKKIKGLYLLMLFTMFIPKVYAFTYEFNASIDDTVVKKDIVKEIIVSIKNIKGTSDGVAACSLNIELDGGITLNSNVRTLNSWSITHQDLYLFDTGNPVLNNTEIFVIPVKVNANGSVKLTNIDCSDGNTTQQISDVNIGFTVANNVNSDNNSSSNESANNSNIQDENIIKDSNCDLSDIKLSEGEIDFDPSVTEYNIRVKDFEKLEVIPVLESELATYTKDTNLTQNGENSIIVTVKSESGNTKIYTLYVEEVSEVKEDSSNKYVPVFIAIIVVLLLINVIRIVLRNKK